jgi:hypothetical protein
MKLRETTVHALQILPFEMRMHKADEVLGFLVHVHFDVLLNSVSEKQKSTYLGVESYCLCCLRNKSLIQTEK